VKPGVYYFINYHNDKHMGLKRKFHRLLLHFVILLAEWVRSLALITENSLLPRFKIRWWIKYSMKI